VNQDIAQLKWFDEKYFEETAHFIAKTQAKDGSIPWFYNGPMDPWDHIEALMGLTIGGKFSEARKGFEWLKRNQLKNGSWLAAYKDGEIEDGTRAETNYVAYIATGVWHYYLVTKDKSFLETMWKTIAKAMDFVISLQGPSGEIFWCEDTKLGVQKDCLVTGCSSIYKSLECATNIGSILEKDVGIWKSARKNLGAALLDHPQCFDQTWESKARFAMDWFYPVLTGVIQGKQAIRHLDERWEEFVVNELGCRCVNDEPWVTVAESCELVMALMSAGQEQKARKVFSWLMNFREDDGSYWTGYVYPDQLMWPEERPTWTAGAVLLAADALTKKTPASSLFLNSKKT